MAAAAAAAAAATAVAEVKPVAICPIMAKRKEKPTYYNHPRKGRSVPRSQVKEGVGKGGKAAVAAVRDRREVGTEMHGVGSFRFSFAAMIGGKKRDKKCNVLCTGGGDDRCVHSFEGTAKVRGKGVKEKLLLYRE